MKVGVFYINRGKWGLNGLTFLIFAPCTAETKNKVIEAEGNVVDATVQGSSLYRINIKIPVFSEQEQHKITRLVAENPALLSRLLNRELPLLSLKAGGTGLNLTAASQVIHFDLWWNPAVEAQATDRAFRIGQKRNVQVHRFITSATFEEK